MAAIGRMDIDKPFLLGYACKSLANCEAFIDGSEYPQYTIKLAK